MNGCMDAWMNDEQPRLILHQLLMQDSHEKDTDSQTSISGGIVMQTTDLCLHIWPPTHQQTRLSYLHTAEGVVRAAGWLR